MGVILCHSTVHAIECTLAHRHWARRLYQTALASTLAMTACAPLSALGLTSEPIQKRRLVFTNPQLFPAGLCPGRPLEAQDQPPTPRSIEDDPATKLMRGQRPLYAAQAAGNVYALPDLQTAKTAEQMIEQMRNFTAHVPANYTIYTRKSDTLSGLKFAIFKPDGESRRPWILAIAGTQTALDWIADLDLGRAQFKQLETLSALFTTCQYVDDAGHPLAAQPWVITGHSLGGGLAQALSYHVQRIRLQRGLMPLKMQLITFNAFGARPLVRKVEDLDEAIVPYLDARNYYVAGDVVSRVGEHIGPTYLVISPGADRKPPLLSKETIRRHTMDTLDKVGGDINQIISGFDTAEERDPDRFADITALGSVASFFPDAIFFFAGARYHRLSQLKAMVDDLIANPDPSSISDVRDYVSDLLLQEYERLVDSGGFMGKTARAQVKAMSALLRRH